MLYEYHSTQLEEESKLTLLDRWLASPHLDTKDVMTGIAEFLLAGLYTYTHRSRINTEDKAKVVAAVWGTELIQFLAALTVLHQDDRKKMMNSSYSSNRPGAK